MVRVRIWDLPTRLFHWVLALLVAAAFVTESIGGNAMVWHGRVGQAILALVTFRVVWGFVGSTYARFATFVRGPAAIKAYLEGRWRGLGHNPLGALSVLALLACLLAQAVTGLFANDDIAFQGPLADLVSSDASNALTYVHKKLEKLLWLLLAAHIGAIAFYVRVKKDNLVRPMITGDRDVEAGEPARGGGKLALLLALAVAVTVAVVASGTCLPKPPPPPVVETPAF